MKKYRLGKTNLMVSEVGLGGIPIARISKDEAVEVVKKAIEKGINFIDTANAYVDSEKKIGQAIKGVREDLIIATKSTSRDGKIFAQHIDNSLKMLQTDYIDIFQIHQVSNDKEIIRVFKQGGAYDMALEAKKAGKIRHIGVTSHRLSAAISLVKTNKFETVQFPGNFVESDTFIKLVPEAKERDMGIIIMKPLGGGVLEDARLCFKYLQQFPECIPIPGMAKIEEVEEIISLYENKEPLTQDDFIEIQKIKEEVGTNFCRRCCYCEPCPQQVNIFAAMAIPRVMKNYGNDYAAPWFVDGAKSIDNCLNCGLCETKCPYSLPIRETIKENKIYFDTHFTGKTFD